MTDATPFQVDGRTVGPTREGWAQVKTEPMALPTDQWPAHKRRLFGGAVQGFDGWGAWGELDAFAVLLYPYDRLPWARLGAKQQSHCALWGCAALRLAGADEAELWAPYEKRNDAVTVLERIGRRRGAWRVPGLDGEPGAGCIVRIGAQLPDGQADPRYVRGTRAGEHVTCLTLVGPDDRVHGVDGGQVDEHGSPALLLRTRRVVRVNGELWYGHTAHGLDARGYPLVGRRVAGWLDVGAMALPRDAYVPGHVARGEGP